MRKLNKTVLIRVVDKPQYSNAKGGIRLRAALQSDGNYIATFGGRALLNIDSRDVVHTNA